MWLPCGSTELYLSFQKWLCNGKYSIGNSKTTGCRSRKEAVPALWRKDSGDVFVLPRGHESSSSCRVWGYARVVPTQQRCSVACWEFTSFTGVVEWPEFYLCVLVLRLFGFIWKSVERRHVLIMVTCWLVIYGCQPCNQQITEFVRTRDAAGIHLVRDGWCAVLREEDFADHCFLLSYLR